MNEASYQSTLREFDYVLVGGGLQNALIAMALFTRRPGVRVALVERRTTLGGNHIWCFHAEDAGRTGHAFVAPLIAHRWSGYTVRFPGLCRTLDAPYAAVTSRRLHDVVTARFAASPGSALMTGVGAEQIEQRAVALADGRRLTARAVIDARGPDPRALAGHTGYQKFLGQELILSKTHALARPVLMDATVAQHDGLRFFYVLPLGPTRLLMEETFFSDTPELDRARVRASIAAHAAARGYRVVRVDREELGVLPMPWRGEDADDARPSGAPLASSSSGPLVAGYRGGWYHPATGYSFPVAVRLAEHVAATEPEHIAGAGLDALRAEHRRQSRFGHLLNRMLFGWFPPAERRHALERFYRLPAATIQRFYALRLTRGDRVRILVGRPPRGLSWRAALASHRGTR